MNNDDHIDVSLTAAEWRLVLAALDREVRSRIAMAAPECVFDCEDEGAVFDPHAVQGVAELRAIRARIVALVGQDEGRW